MLVHVDPCSEWCLLTERQLDEKNNEDGTTKSTESTKKCVIFAIFAFSVVEIHIFQLKDSSALKAVVGCCPCRAGRISGDETQGGVCFADLPWAVGCSPVGASAILPGSRHMNTASHNKFTVGTLTYDKRGLWLVFFWLMWNDFSITLLEQVTGLTGILMRDRGASYTLMATFGTVGGLLGMWINPVFSTWSDRLRTRFGRRRPILLIATPLFAVSLCAIAFMPDLYHFLMRFDLAAGILNRIPVNGEVLFIGVASIVNGLFNGVVLAIFSYYYWDVVPEIVLGRFNSLAKIVTVGAGMVWNFFVIGYAEHHTKTVYIGVSVFCLSVYLLSV